MKYIDPVKDIGALLLQVEKPSRYVGGEYGIYAKKDSVLKTVIAFPDLYEIGMGNQALKIIYNRLNEIPDISCDRAFAPAPDFEKLLHENKIPLYGLETGLSLNDFDIVMFTLGYELSLNGTLTMLAAGGIPLHCKDRNEEEISCPIVIAGGPIVSNPLPFSPFIDAFWIGEAEAGFFDLAQELQTLKKSGAGRAVLLERIKAHPNIWVKDKEKAKRAIYSGFPTDTKAPVFPIPSMKIVQNHGTVEIMRGCPNGCRFCHAGFWYRPMRQKNGQFIFQQVENLVKKGGWQQISLSSLSSGDYCGITELVETLNDSFSPQHVSFQLPSLKVSGFSLNLLEKLSVTRKSGLTFAVETPRDLWQMAINKEVTRDSVVAILEEAKKRGWKSAKFYFMIGLLKNFNAEDAEEEFKEEQEIVNFITEISMRTRMKFNINVGVFIPKPHTPYQWAEQISAEEAGEKLYFIRSALKPTGHKVSTSDLLISKIEGLLSRGDERAGYIAEKAYLGGSRLDAWDDYINREKWEELLNENAEYLRKINGPRISTNLRELKLSWSCIESGVSNEYLHSELEKSNNSQKTQQCDEKCKKCGLCDNDKIKINKNPLRRFEETHFASSALNSLSVVNHKNTKVNNDIYRLLFSFSKQNTAVFHGHLSLIDIFSMSLRRAEIPVIYTQGFNPLAKMEFASPLSIGVFADSEIASVDFQGLPDTNEFMEKLNKSLPDDIRINKAECFYIPHGIKQKSLTALLWGFAYQGLNSNKDFVFAKDEKDYRKKRLENDCKSLIDLKRLEVLARDKESYFTVYSQLYNICK